MILYGQRILARSHPAEGFAENRILWRQMEISALYRKDHLCCYVAGGMLAVI